MLEYIQSCLSKFGLPRWCPDLRQTPYALYNAACRVVALDTFKQALVSHAYAHLKPNTTYAKDMTWLIRFYDHVVHYYMYARYKKESRNPGSVRAADEATPQYRGRVWVCTYNYTDPTQILMQLTSSSQMLDSIFSRRITTRSVIKTSLIRKLHLTMSWTQQARKFTISRDDLSVQPR
jgi:hypothetical protein